jgi:hypothetical protein
MKLQSMTDYVLEQEIKGLEPQSIMLQLDSRARRFTNCLKYAKFLKQPLELWMFVPCGDDGDILENPSCNTSCDPSDFSEDGKCGINGCYAQENNYQKAKERCLLEGFKINQIENPIEYSKSITDESGVLHIAWFSKITCSWHFSKTLKFIESIGSGWTLTQTAIDQIIN